MNIKKNKLISSLISLFYPITCSACGEVLSQNEQHICTHCLLHLPETNYHKSDDNPLKTIFLGRARVENAAALFYFKKGDNVQHILHSLKYKGDKEIGAFLGAYYGRRLVREKNYRDIDLILPIPLHKKKFKIRGYNQSEWIAKGLSEGMGIPYRTDLLVRTEFTETQTHKTRFNRWENVRDVFAVEKEESLIGKHVLVCDDVLTTGATTEAAIQKLLKIDGVRVSVVALACAN